MEHDTITSEERMEALREIKDFGQLCEGEYFRLHPREANLFRKMSTDRAQIVATNDADKRHVGSIYSFGALKPVFPQDATTTRPSDKNDASAILARLRGHLELGLDSNNFGGGVESRHAEMGSQHGLSETERCSSVSSTSGKGQTVARPENDIRYSELSVGLNQPSKQDVSGSSAPPAENFSEGPSFHELADEEQRRILDGPNDPEWD